MKLDITLPTQYRVGSIHSEGIRSLGKNVVFEVVGWYINHYTEPGIKRYIKDGNAIAIREVDPSALRTQIEERKHGSRSIRMKEPRRYSKPTLNLRGDKPVKVIDLFGGRDPSKTDVFD